MPSHYTPIHAYRLTTIRTAQRNFAETAYGIQMVDQPEVGRPMVMFGQNGNQRIVTSRVLRMFAQGRGSTYVETANTLYLLENRGFATFPMV